MICQECGCDILGDGVKYCSSRCSAFATNRKRKENGWTRTEESKKKTSDALKGRKYPERTKTQEQRKQPKLYKLKCKCCDADFEHTLKTKLYCSKNCLSKNIGGYRNGSGRSKSGYYNGIYCGSTYELVWVIYQLDHEIKFSRFKGCISSVDKKLKYFPDFLMENTIVEIKGWEDRAKVLAKNNLAKDHGYDIIVLYKEDLKHMFEWVKNKYYYKHVFELYDNYKPTFQYTCSHCSNVFPKERKLLTETKYCSRICSGHGVRTKLNELLNEAIF